MAQRRTAEFKTMGLIETQPNAVTASMSSEPNRQEPTVGDMNFRGNISDGLVELCDSIVIKDLDLGVKEKGAYPSLGASQKMAVGAMKRAAQGQTARQKVEPARGMVRQAMQPKPQGPPTLASPEKPSLAPSKKCHSAGIETKASKVTGALKWTGLNVGIPVGIGLATAEAANRLQDRRNRELIAGRRRRHHRMEEE